MLLARSYLRPRGEGIAEAVRRVRLFRRKLHLSEVRHGNAMSTAAVSAERADKRRRGMLQILPG